MTIQAKAASRDSEIVPSARRTAEHATFQNFANCYLREIDAGATVGHPVAFGSIVDCVECGLPAQRAALRIEILAASLCGPHSLGRSFLRRSLENVWREVEPMTALQAMLQEAYRRVDGVGAERLRGCELELLSRVLDSYRVTERLLAAKPDDADDDSFLGAERSLTFGHWLHPTPKSRQGMTEWQQPVFSPELGGAFQLFWFSARAELVAAKSAAPEGVGEIVAAIAGDDLDSLAPPEGEALVPMHPLQAQAMLLDPDVQAQIAGGGLRALGQAGPAFAATASVRTVYSPDVAWMLKFSLPVRITNSVRRNRRHELEAGVAMARLFERSDFLARRPRLKIMRDPAYLTIDLPGRAESGFETIFRENPFMRGADRGVATVAALSAEPRPGARSRLDRIIKGVARDESSPVAAAARRWFSAYLDCALDPLLALYDELGVALEAHQQNSVIELRNGCPVACHYRDSQGYYLSNAYRGTLARIAPETEAVAHLYYDDAAIRDPFAYYLIVNQIFSVISRMGRDGLAAEAVLVADLQSRLDELTGTLSAAGRDFARSLLDGPTIAAKANLVTRIFGIDELASGDETARYHRLPNPIAGYATGAHRSRGHAVAV